MLKAKQMPKKKQTKQTKKPAKNDGKITKKKYIKTKIIGGKMIQLLTLNEKLEYLKDCLKKAVSTLDSVDVPHDYFKLYRIISNLQEDYNDDIVFKKIEFSSIFYKESSFDNCLKYILLCLSDHDEYNSYTLLKLRCADNISYEKPITNTFEFLDISDDRMDELEKNASSYYLKYKSFLEDFIKNIISVATDADPAADDGVVGDDADSDNVVGDDTVRETAPTTLSESASSPTTLSESASSPTTLSATPVTLGTAVPKVTGVGTYNDRQFGTDRQFSTGPQFGTYRRFSTGPQFAGAQDQKAESEKIFFETSMFQIYNEGIVLLTIDDITNTKHTLKVFKSVNKVAITLSETDAIIQFFNTNNDILIIRRYNSNLATTYYQWDCMIQLMYKLVNILLDNIDDYKKAIQTQLETNLKKRQLLQKYKTTLLDKLIAIIFEKLPPDVTAIKYGIILKSLKVIILNNKGIDDTYIDEEYTKYLKNRKIEDTNIKNIIALSNDKMPTYRFAAKCDDRKEYFEHIINVLYTNKDGDTDETEKYKDEEVNEDLEILIKLSASASSGVSLLGKTFEENCNTTINKIKKEKGYLISEASIQSLELKDKYYTLERSTINSEKEIEIESALKKYYELINKYINKEIKGLYYDIKYEPTTRAILKIYDEFRTTFNTKINYLPNVNALKPITATRVIQ